jgi:hypothetical protein
MPSLFKYFAFVGAALLGLLSLANFLLDPSTGATVVGQSAPAKPAVVVQHDPRASKIERWRDEQAALRSAVTEPAPATTAAAKATVQPVTAAPAVEPAKPVEQAPAAVAAAPAPATPAATVPGATPMQTSDAAAITGVQTDEERAAEVAHVKAVRAAKVRKARAARQKAEQVARERDIDQFFRGERQRNASNQQDQYYYSQRVTRERQSFNAYAPRQQGFGPFGW